ncbi:ferredoxin [Actinoplanes awajinensis]|uniref:Ferredoxin n=1 Tax=Actinoplanes awajinensis subsp. mycoplanecinus TaxID=135947 RepID=A0A0X3VA57_9ACTN|nr:ferredoxin [Actinoplanes awajinensis]KUL41655.1 ferredoxin [Actinoplanes awajinensis subsp. mycoplanecinus]
MRVIADPRRCVGAGQCVLTEPALFDQDPEDGTVIVLDENPSGDLVEAARDAALVCPSQALSVVD